MSLGLRAGVDAGGTFTDLVILDEGSGEVVHAKVPSTPGRPEVAFVEGLVETMTAHGLDLGQFTAVLHGTTVATNALLERKGAPTVLLTTAGFRDVLEIRRHVRGFGEIYDLFYAPPPPLVPRHLRLEVEERIDAAGAVVAELDATAAMVALRRHVADGIRSIAVCFINAHVNARHERLMQALLAAEFPDCQISISSDVSPEIREYERTSTTVVNALLRPLISRYLRALEGRLLEAGIRAPLRIMQSNGGIVSASAAAERPVQLVMSGPAAGVVGGTAVGVASGARRVITMDMGGTSCDVCVVDGTPRTTAMRQVAGHPIRIPSFDVRAIGAGGGSLAWVDDGGAMRVGPQSAGADPGPACYPHGGQVPTITDANLVLGRLNPDYFLGGSLRLNVNAARVAIEEQIGRRFGIGVEEAAAGILRIANAAMAESIKVVSLREGFDPRDFVLVAFGGAGPTHAGAVARELQIPLVLIPIVPGTLSALGLLASDFRHDYVRPFLRRLDDATPVEIDAILRGLERRAAQQLEAEGVEPDRVSGIRMADLRHVGQASEITIPLGDPIDQASIAAAFHAAYERLYAHASTGGPIELVALRLAAVGRIPQPGQRVQAVGRAQPIRAARKGERHVYFEEFGHPVVCPIYDRAMLRAGNRFEGPAIFEQLDTTTVLFPGQHATVDRTGTMRISDGLD